MHLDRLSDAVRDLAAGKGGIRSRLKQASIPLWIEDPRRLSNHKEIYDEFMAIYGELYKDGRRSNDTIDAMSKEKASEIAERILWLYARVEGIPTP